MRARWLLLCLPLLILPRLVLAQDRDNDGLPDDIEAQLGTNPDLDEGLCLVADDKTRDTGDTSIKRDGRAPDVDKVYFAHVGGDRLVWKVTFAAPYPEKGTIFHLYTDLDDDKATGRQDAEWVRGCDVMYSFVDARSDPRLINGAARASQAVPVRGIVQGNCIYGCDDVRAATRDSKTHFRFYVLSHMTDPASDSDTIPWTYCEVPMHPERTPPKLPFPEAENAARIAMPNLAQLCYNLWHDPGTIRLLPRDATIAGYTLLMNDDLVGQGSPEESVSWSSPVEGNYHLGLILRDQGSKLEGLEVRVGGERVACFVGLSPTTRDVLCFTDEPVALSKGQTLQVRSAEHSAPVTFQSVCLLGSRPEIPKLVIENLTCWHLPDEPGQRPGRLMVAWTTNRPTDGSVRYRLAGPEAYYQEGVLEEGRGFVNNHFLLLPPELGASGYSLEITCREPPQETYEAQTAGGSLTVWRTPRMQAAREGRRPEETPQPLRIPLTVHEPTGQARRAWPVSSGVPLPQGAVPDPLRCRLLGPDGDPVPAQFEALAWWPDSLSVRWLLVDFLAETHPHAEAVYTLECNADPAMAASPLHLETGPTLHPDYPRAAPLGAVTLPVKVITGPLALQLDRGGFVPFANVTLNGRRLATPEPGACGFEITDETGAVFSSARVEPEEVLIEEAGPVRATVCVKGKLASADGASFMRYLCRMSVWAGQPWVKVTFSLDNDVTKATMTRFRSLQVRVPAGLTGATITAGADGSTLSLASGTGLLQDEDNHFVAGDTTGKRAEGWLLASGDNGALAVAVRDFWQLYPKGLSADATGMSIGLLPPLPETQYAGASEDDVNKLYFWCDKGHYRVRTGVRLTTEFAVDFAPQVSTQGLPAYALGACWQQPLFAACTPQWYCESGAFGPMVARQAGKFEVYERKLDESFTKFLQRREAIREYGFMNYGDWFGERKWNWGNQEYDTAWGLAANFARTGNLDLLWRAEQAERHNADIDTVHWSANPREVGAVWGHCTGHTGGYFADDWKGMGWFNRGAHDTGHTWDRGHFIMYAITGERRFLETGRAVADWFANTSTDFHFYSERNVGWPLVGLAGAYLTEPNPVYLNAAKLMADAALWNQHPERGGWGHFQDPAECKHTPRCWGSKPFMSGTLLAGLKQYDLLQPREDIKACIRTNCDFLWRECYIPADNGFCYSQCRTFAPKGQTWTISLVGNGLAYGCLLDPQQAHKDVLLRATAGFMAGGFSEFGKSLTQNLCFMPHMLHDLDALGLTTIPSP